jgi:nanoRNase/pAp phosphatase (c-di-AMP/oligoRNAs hydrolase)
LKVALVGFGPINRRLARLLKERLLETVVVDERAKAVEEARAEGLQCLEGLISDEDIASQLSDVEAFVLLDLEALRVDRLIKHLRRHHPQARIFATDLEVRQVPSLETFSGDGKAVRVGTDAIAEVVMSEIEDHMAKRSADRLVEVLKGGKGGEVAVFTHDDPDPDAIAAAIAMIRICQELDLEVKVYHGGGLNRLQNRFFARLVEAHLSRITPEEAEVVVGRADRVVLVDAGQPGVNNVLPEGSVPNIVLDHHSTNREVYTADYCDVRPSMGSASTLLTGYLQQLGIVPSSRLAAALLFGLRTDTDHLRRNAYPADVKASAYLASLADQALLDMVEHPPIAPSVIDVIGTAIAARIRAGDHLFTWCGEVGSREDLSQVADLLLNEENVAAVFAFGRVGDKVFVSARSVRDGPHVGDITRRAMGDIGSGGGHPTMGGGVVTLRLGVGLDVDSFVVDDLYQAFADAAGVELQGDPANP